MVRMQGLQRLGDLLGAQVPPRRDGSGQSQYSRRARLRATRCSAHRREARSGARSALRYGISPEVAASLIADAMFLVVCMSPDAIIAALIPEPGWKRNGCNASTERGVVKAAAKVAVRMGNQLWLNSLNPEAIACLMLELVDLTTWSQHVRHALSGDIGPRDTAMALLQG